MNGSQYLRESIYGDVIWRHTGVHNVWLARVIRTKLESHLGQVVVLSKLYYIYFYHTQTFLISRRITSIHRSTLPFPDSDSMGYHYGSSRTGWIGRADLWPNTTIDTATCSAVLHQPLQDQRQILRRRSVIERYCVSQLEWRCTPYCQTSES